MIIKIDLSIPNDTAKRIVDAERKAGENRGKINELRRLWEEMSDAPFDASQFRPKAGETDRLIDTEVLTAEYRKLLRKKIVAEVMKEHGPTRVIENGGADNIMAPADSHGTLEDDPAAHEQVIADTPATDSRGREVPVQLKKKRGRPPKGGTARPAADDLPLINDGADVHGFNIIYEEGLDPEGLYRRIFNKLPDFLRDLDSIPPAELENADGPGGFFEKIRKALGDDAVYARVRFVVKRIIDDYMLIKSGTLPKEKQAATIVRRARNFKTGLGIEILACVRDLSGKIGTQEFFDLYRKHKIDEKMAVLKGSEFTDEYQVCLVQVQAATAWQSMHRLVDEHDPGAIEAREERERGGAKAPPPEKGINPDAGFYPRDGD